MQPQVRAMSWSDDEWDADEALAKHSEAKAKEDASDGDSEEEEAPTPAPAPAPAAKPKAAGKKEPKSKESGYPKDTVSVPLADPVAEKQRKQKLVEEADQRLAADLFDGCGDREASAPAPSEGSTVASSAQKEESHIETKTINKDSLEELELKFVGDVDKLVKMLVPKLKEAEAKQAQVKFVTDLMKGLQVKLTLPELEQVHKVLKDLLNKRKKEEVEREKAKKLKEAKEEEEKKQAAAKAADPFEGEPGAAPRISDEDYFAEFM